jgi:hypothetical protein
MKELRLWEVDRYLGRLAEHCDRLSIAHPSAEGLRNELQSAIAQWQQEGDPAHAFTVAATALAAGPAAQGQGLFRVEWTAGGGLNLAARVLPHIPDAKRGSLTAVSLPSPTWSSISGAAGSGSAADSATAVGVTGTKHGRLVALH